MSQPIGVSEIVELSLQSLRANGLSDSDSTIVVRHLLECELSGKASHGFYRLPALLRSLKEQGSGSELTVEKETLVSALLRGNGRLGLVAAEQAMNMAREKAAAYGIAAIGAYDFIGTTGSMGYYTRRLALANVISIMIANSEYAVAPWGGKDAVLGTNPISVAIPSETEPIVADLATSAWSYGDLALAMMQNRRVPEGVVIDKDGNPSTDPHDADNGSMLSMAGHKGYALGLAIELLAGPLVRAKAGREAVPGSDGLLIIALSPSLFTDVDIFKHDVFQLSQEIKRTPPLRGVNEVLLPGERSARVRDASQLSGQIKVEAELLDQIRQLSK